MKRMHNFAAGLAALACALAGSASHAQEFVAVPAGQDALIVEAVDAARDDQLELAEAKYRAALQLGDLNIAYLGLARVTQRTGDCGAATQLYGQAIKAPAADAPYPSPDELKLVVERYRRDDATLCRGIIVLVCDYPNTTVHVDGKPAACGQRLEASAGDHEVEGRIDDRRITLIVRVVGLEDTLAQVKVPAPEPVAHEEPILIAAQPAPPLDEGLAPAWWFVGTGGLFLVATGGFYLAQIANDQDIEARAQAGIPDAATAREARDLVDTGDRLRWAQWSTGTLGVVSLAAGLAWLLVGDEPQEAALRIGLWGGDAVGVMVGGTLH